MYSIYKLLICEDARGEDWRDEEKRKKEIAHIVVNYGYEEFEFLFSICKKTATKQVRNDWCLQRSIEFVFESVNTDSKKYLLAMKAYFKMNTPYLFRINDKIARLIKLISIDEIKLMIDNLDEVNKMIWKAAFYEELPEEQISIDTVREMFDFISGKIEFENMRIPSIYSLSKYKNKGIDIVEQITIYLLNVGEKKPFIVVDFFGRVFDDEKIEEIIDFFDGDTEKLLKLYLISMEINNFDFDGRLLLRLIQVDIAYWSEITIKCSRSRECNLNSRLFDKIWMQDNYCDLIDIAYSNMRDSYFYHLRDDAIINMFASSEKNKPLIMERKEMWIREYIYKHAYNEDKIKDIFDVIVAAFPDKRLEYIKEFLGKNSNVDIFKTISLFPSFRSWSGSEVPLIEKDIEFLERLVDEIFGMDYLEHKLYIKELISRHKRYKQTVLENEYIENFARI